ncbi:MAG: tetratricopeptide repeat protein [Thermoanaerobaculia bacterium]|nr:tetratricopeptide repeat protein [Thermoanaerobaculia bacterium]
MRIRLLLAAAMMLVVGFAGGLEAKNVDSSAFRGKSKKDAGKALLDEALKQAGKGSWERIAVGRVYYLGGMKAEGQKIFEEVLAKKPEWSDKYRVARVYWEAGEWKKAQPIFDEYVTKNPKDDKGIAEVGSFYLLQGNRERAEELFVQSFKRADEVWSTVNAAGAYLGVQPQP